MIYSALCFALLLGATLASSSVDPAVPDVDDPYVGSSSVGPAVSDDVDDDFYAGTSSASPGYEDAFVGTPTVRPIKPSTSKPVAKRTGRLTTDDVLHLHKIISAGDHPAVIAKALGGFTLQCDPATCQYINEYLEYMIKANFVESFKALHSRIRFPRQTRVNRYLLTVAVEFYRAELCEYLMSQEMDRRFYASFASDRDWARAIGLFEGHPDFVVHYAPDMYTMASCDTRKACLGIVKFNRHYAHQLATVAKCQPDALLEGLLENSVLGDRSMAIVLEALFEEGASVTQDQIEEFSQSHTKHKTVLGMLQRRFEETRPKPRPNVFVRAFQRFQTFSGRS